MKVFCLRSKSESEDCTKNYILKIQTQFGKKIKFVRHDGAHEFATNSIKTFYEDQGIEQQVTVPYAHQTNGTAERAIRTIVTIGRSLLHHEKLEKCFWTEAAMKAIYIKNRLPSPKIDHKTPFEIVYKSKPSVKHMRVFGCQAYILTLKVKRMKCDSKARVRMFMGYEEASKAYRVYDIEVGQAVISRDFTSDKSTFDFSMRRSSDDDEDAELDLNLLAINNDDVRQTVYKHTGKCKSEAITGMSRSSHHRTGLEQASVPERVSNRHQKRRSSDPETMSDDEEDVGAYDQDDDFDRLELTKAIYGLKQASRVWNENFDVFVCSIGFEVPAFDPCLYIKVVDGQCVPVLVYVDGVLVTGSSLELIAQRRLNSRHASR
uniref:Integrase catalytic domain-containing protein n=1 Tax=Peronospora matthiolae TaxID=2874970 RepID=A0AAV1VB90_9STRA